MEGEEERGGRRWEGGEGVEEKLLLMASHLYP